jgi:single-stranded DNA-binding protein
MSQVKAVFTGGIVAEPERREVNGASLLEFPVYVNHSKKNKDTGEFVPTGDTTKVKVTLWRELADNTDVRKGDLVEVSGTIVEKEFDKKDGTKGRQIQTDWVESVVVKYRKDAELVGAAAGFDSTEGGF